MRTSALLLIAAWPVLAGPPCSVPDGLRAFQRQWFQTLPAEKISERDHWLEQRYAAARALRDEHPNEFFAHWFYLESISNTPTIRLREEAAGYYRDRDPFLYARSLMGVDTPRSIQLLNDVLVKDPDHAFAHRTLAYVHGMWSNFRDNGKFAHHVRRYVELCPDSVDLLVMTRGAPDAELQAFVAQRLRPMLAGRTDELAVRAYPTLWAAEFQTSAPTTHDALREQVKRDLEQVERAPDSPARSRARSDAGRLIGVPMPSPKPPADEGDEWNEWLRENPGPAYDADPETVRAYWRRRLTKLDEMSTKSPHAAFFTRWRLNALENAPDATPQEIEDAVRRVRQRESTRVFYVDTNPADLEIASLYVRKGMHLEAVSDLVSRGLERGEYFATHLDDMLTQPRNREMFQQSFTSAQAQAWAVLIDCHLAAKNVAAARQVASRFDSWLALQSDSAAAKLYGSLRNEKFGDIALAEGREKDALALMKKALEIARFRYGPIAAKVAPLIEKHGESRAEWDVLTQAKQQQVRVAIAGSSRGWEAQTRTLPSFSLKDLAGRTWTLADLQGKPAVVNVWATWCEPCRKELPALQALHDSGVRVITLNSDDNTGVVGPFLKQNSYSFPVLFAHEYTEAVLQVESIPRTWIVDGSGRIRFELKGFDPDRRFAEEVRGLLEKLR